MQHTLKITALVLAGLTVALGLFLALAYLHGPPIRLGNPYKMRFNSIRQVGAIYLRRLADSGENREITPTDLRDSLPAGFPLDRYQLLAPHTNQQGVVLVREVAPDHHGVRVFFYADGHAQARRE
jgi:hypothetical protein